MFKFYVDYIKDFSGGCLFGCGLTVVWPTNMSFSSLWFPPENQFLGPAKAHLENCKDCNVRARGQNVGDTGKAGRLTQSESIYQCQEV